MRQKNNLTQQNVAEKTGVTPQAVSKWERCESLPDITLLPELAQIFGVTVEDIITAGKSGTVNDTDDVMRSLNLFVDERTFEKVKNEFTKAESIRDLSIPIEIFMALNGGQKDILLELFLEKDDYALFTDEIIRYLNVSQRTKLIMSVAENGDFDALETLIPFMGRAVRTEVVTLLLKRGRYDFLEEMILFLTHDQKETIIRYFSDNKQEIDIPENLFPLFDTTTRDRPAAPADT
ncbi:MAG: helix-turn-helix domain-containing protein [Oscillospiraceae bacterium]|nr:helix-turn-helix domain-containing protein [Oscillospiraceae bacterium]